MMENIQYIESLGWPIAIVLLGLLFKSPLTELIKKTRKVEYQKNESGRRFKASFVVSGLIDTKQNLDVLDSDKLPNLPNLSNPKSSILKSYENLEIIAKKKLIELNVEKNIKGGALRYLMYKEAFPPKIESAINSLQLVRNQVSHSSSGDISEDDAKEFLAVILKIEKIIGVLDSLPAMNLGAITMIIRSITKILDSNKYSSVSIDDVHRHIEDGTILDFLIKMDEAKELKGILNSELWKGFDKFYIQSLQSLFYGYQGDERRKWGIENSGICLLLAWTNEIIQMGSGWHPNTNLSELSE